MVYLDSRGEKRVRFRGKELLPTKQLKQSATSGGKTHPLQPSPSSFQTSQVTSNDPDGMPPFRVVFRFAIA
jgi:hypothetical protein